MAHIQPQYLELLMAHPSTIIYLNMLQDDEDHGDNAIHPVDTECNPILTQPSIYMPSIDEIIEVFNVPTDAVTPMLKPFEFDQRTIAELNAVEPNLHDKLMERLDVFNCQYLVSVF